MPLDAPNPVVATAATGARTLAGQLAAKVALRIEHHALKPGTRLPSIRALATAEGVSRSTVVEAYDRLIAGGHIESRRGSGFYVCAERVVRHTRKPPPQPALARGSLDVVGLLR